MKRATKGTYKDGYNAGYKHYLNGGVFNGGTVSNIYTGGFVDGYNDAKNGIASKFE